MKKDKQLNFEEFGIDDVSNVNIPKQPKSGLKAEFSIKDVTSGDKLTIDMTSLIDETIKMEDVWRRY